MAVGRVVASSLVACAGPAPLEGPGTQASRPVSIRAAIVVSDVPPFDGGKVVRSSAGRVRHAVESLHAVTVICHDGVEATIACCQNVSPGLAAAI